MQPTAEQQAARDVFASGRDLALIAGAGTGKTTTLMLMGEATVKRGLYVAFNKAAAVDAGRRFGRNVECRTSHSVAYDAVGREYKDRLNNSPHRPSKETAALLGLTEDLDVAPTRLTLAHQARLVMGMVKTYCHSADPEIAVRHMERVNGLDPAAHEFVAAHLLPYAVRAWADIRSHEGVLKFGHDHYVKIWGLSKPRLPGDFILLDEAQDTNPVVEEVFLAQSAQRVCVGDPAQQIYAWRNARDVMTGFPAEHLYLTESFRFGQPIADEANRWLVHAGSPMRLRGRGPADSRVGAVEHPDAVLCRGNSDSMQEVLDHLDQGTPVALTGGGGALRRLAEAAIDLKAGRHTSHHELFLFTTWGEVQDYAEKDREAQTLRSIVHLIDSFGPDTIIDAVDRLCAEEEAKVIVSTAHRAKGREWDTVRIGSGFRQPSVDEFGVGSPLRQDEARLIYVAVTRARHVLDDSSLSWLDGYEKRMSGAGPAVDRRTLIDLPLTGQLKFPGSPVSEFMAEHLPRTGPLYVQFLKFAASLPYPVQPLEVRSPDWAALGHAVDFRIRLSLGSGFGPAVSHGVTNIGSPLPLPGAPDRETRAALFKAGKFLQASVDWHFISPGRFDEEELSRLCFVAAYYEDLYRSGGIRTGSMFDQAKPTTTLTELTEAVPAYAVEDLARQLALADEPFRDLRALPEHAKICGPVFEGSADLGGADADFILDGLLLDCKATRNPRRLGRAELHQLAGYLLLDYSDHYGIDRVGLYLSRQGGMITWPVDEFLHSLGATMPLDRLRGALRRHLRNASR
ncbi:MAG TPA: UvrD-helicase domain-containing protein [Actinocrinis sp.]|nr:UvrD-helicase domain-containing protein [Actinocrinis sp.]